MGRDSTTPLPEPACVFVIDDDASVRDALEDLLSSVGLDVRLFASAQDFLSGERPDGPACMVLDIRMPGLSGLDFQRQMADFRIETPVIFITAHGDIAMCARAMKAGAIEFLTKPFRDQDLLDAIQSALQKDRVRRLNAEVVAELRRRFDELNAGEREVLVGIVAGLLNKQIAARLQLSEITVKVRRGHIMRKMRARSLVDLVRMTEKLGISPEQNSRLGGLAQPSSSGKFISSA
jgi:FixJ family two-component response regulator